MSGKCVQDNWHPRWITSGLSALYCGVSTINNHIPAVHACQATTGDHPWAHSEWKTDALAAEWCGCIDHPDKTCWDPNLPSYLECTKKKKIQHVYSHCQDKMSAPKALHAQYLPTSSLHATLQAHIAHMRYSLSTLHMQATFEQLDFTQSTWYRIWHTYTRVGFWH